MNLSLASGGFGRAHSAHATHQHKLLLSEEDEAPARIAETAGTAGKAFAIEDVGLRHLKTLAEIERILHLRDEIDLSVHSAAGAAFHALEKKETSAVSSARSN